MHPTEPTLAQSIDSARRYRLADLLWRSAARTPNKTALVYKGLRRSFAELDTVVNRLANAMTQCGIGRGDHVALISHNNDAFVVTRFALARLGAVVVPIVHFYGPKEVRYILDTVETKSEQLHALNRQHSIPVRELARNYWPMPISDAPVGRARGFQSPSDRPVFATLNAPSYPAAASTVASQSPLSSLARRVRSTGTSSAEVRSAALVQSPACSDNVPSFSRTITTAESSTSLSGPAYMCAVTRSGSG